MNQAVSTGQPAHKPGIGGYVAAGLVFAVAMAVFAVVLFTQIRNLGHDFLRVTAPGEHVLTLDAGPYTIFHESRSSPTGRVESGTIDGLTITVTPQGAGEPPLLTPDRSSRYSLQDRSGVSLFRFTVATPGPYRLSALYPEGRAGAEAGLALAHDFTGWLLGVIFTGLAIAFGGAALAAGIAFVTWRRRRVPR